MSNELTYHEVEQLLPSYALGALEPEEMLAVEATLDTYSGLHGRASELEVTICNLASLAPDVPLPLEVRDRLEARIQHDLAESPLAPETALAFEQPLGSKTTRQAVGPQPDQRVGVLSRFEGLAALFRRWAPTASALAAVLLVAVYTGRLQMQLGQARSELDAIHETVTSMQQTDETLKTELKLFAIAERTLELEGRAIPEARGKFHLSGREGVLVVSGLTPLPADQAYQIWLLSDGAPLSAGLLKVPAEGLVATVVSVPASAENFTAVQITIEPAGGSPALAGPVVLESVAP